MGIVEDKIKELKAREAKVKQMGGEKAVAKHKEKGKLTARERLDELFDAGTFREIDAFVTHRCVNFGMEDVEVTSDGVVTGHGLVDGRPVFAYAQDFTSRAGSLGGEILGIGKHRAAVDQTVSGDHTVGGNLYIFHAEVHAAVCHKRVNLPEGPGIE